jgi:hypothetical protein
MSKYENLFSISPSLLLAQLEQDIDQLRDRQARLDSLAEDMRSFAGSLLEKEVVGCSARQMHKWHYDARFPNYLLSNVYQTEKERDLFKRWVGPARNLQLVLPLDRSVQHDLSIRVVNFQTPEIKSEFVLMVDGEELPWIGQEANTYTAIIPEDRRQRDDEQTRISIGARDAVPAPETATVWFSFSYVTIEAR